MAYTILEDKKRADAVAAKKNGTVSDNSGGKNVNGSGVGVSADKLNAAVGIAPTTAAPKPASGGYDAAADTNYQAALKNLQTTQATKPIYANSYESQLNDLYNSIVNREKFAYDINADALYQQYKEQYANMGKLAMRDTMGQAAALTGGYGSTYGQAVGQQQYNAYLQQLNDVVPELYGMAYGMYQDEGNALMNQYGMLGDMAADEYGKYQDSMNNYWQDVSYQQGLADDAYNRGYQQWSDQYAMQQSSYDRLVDMMMTMGYVPTAEELAAAGMSNEHANAYMAYYNKLNPKSSGGGYTGSPKKEPTLQEDELSISNSHGESWVQVPGHGRVSYQELESMVNNGTVKETIVDGKVTYSQNRGSSSSGKTSGSSGSSGSSSSSSSSGSSSNSGKTSGSSGSLWDKYLDVMMGIYK